MSTQTEDYVNGSQMREYGERWGFDGWELHCGDCFQVREGMHGPWYDVRIEHGSRVGWYLVGLPLSLTPRQLWNFRARRYP